MDTKSQKDKEMAARLKRENVRRTTCRCPICHRLINLKNVYSHIVGGH